MHIKASLVYSCHGPDCIFFGPCWNMGKDATHLTSVFTQVSADKGRMVAHLVSEIPISGLERKKGNTELNMTF